MNEHKVGVCSVDRDQSIESSICKAPLKQSSQRRLLWVGLHKQPSLKAQLELFATNSYTVYAGAPKTITDKLQRVLNATARVVSDTKKYDLGLSTHASARWTSLAWCVRKGNVQADVPLFARSSTSLPDELIDPARSFDSFRQFLKAVLFSLY